METANVLLAIGGDRGHTVPKYDVTAAEAAVMRFVHGDDAVFDIELVGEVTRTHRQEIARLSEAYGRQEGERRVSPAVEALYPGAAARVFETFAELEIPEQFYIAENHRSTRAKAEEAAPAAAGEVAAIDLNEMTVNKLRGRAEQLNVDLTGITKKADIIAAIEAAPAPIVEDDTVDENDGTGEMPDANLFK